MTRSNELDELEKRIAAAKLSPEAAEVAKKQLKRLAHDDTAVGRVRRWCARTSTGSSTCPGSPAVAREPDIAKVRAVLDADHYGLEKVKRRILEYLAVRKLKSAMPERRGIRRPRAPSCASSARPASARRRSASPSPARWAASSCASRSAACTTRPQIRGHRRTYVGALPGQIIQGMKKAGSTNPVFMLDEVDKLGSDYRGDPRRRCSRCSIPSRTTPSPITTWRSPTTSQVVFVATANVGDTIPAPLRDRMEIIEIPGYTRTEKLAIAQAPSAARSSSREHGMTAEQIESPTRRSRRSSIGTRARQASARSSDRSRPSSAGWW